MKFLCISSFLILAITLVSISTSSKLSGRIYNGHEAELGMFPYQALLYMKQGGNSFSYCGGTLISPAFVLTIAQCILSDDITVMLGVVDLTEENQEAMFTSTVYRTIVHPDYDRYSLANDIALVWLRYQYKGGNDAIGVIALPPRSGADPSVFDNQEGVIAGWGETYLSEFIHLKLLYGKVHVMPHEECVKNLTGLKDVSDKQLCADLVLPAKACRGDGGGALAVSSGGNTFVAGLYSFSVGACSGDFPSGYTNVAAYLDWISSYTGIEV